MKVHRVLVVNSKTGFVWCIQFADNDGGTLNMLECMAWWAWNGNTVLGHAIGEWDMSLQRRPVGHITDMVGGKLVWFGISEMEITTLRMVPLKGN